MPLKSVNAITPDDVLGEDVTTAQGAVLVKAGAILSDDHVRTLKMWGVESVWVAVANGKKTGWHAVSEEWETLLDRAETALQQRFGDSLDNEVMAEIFRVGVTLWATKMAAATTTAVK